MNRESESTRQLGMFKSNKKEEKRLKKKIKSRFDGRWAIAALFFLTILASLFFYLRTELPIWVKDIFSLKVVISKPPR